MRTSQFQSIEQHYVRFEDVDEQARYLNSWTQSYDQISAGHFEGFIKELWINDIQFINEYCSQSVHQNGTSWDNSCCFIVPISQHGNAVFQDKVMDINSPMILHANEVLDYRTCLKQQAIAIVISNDVLTKISGLSGCQHLEVLLKKEKLISFEQASLTKLKTALIQLFEISKNDFFNNNNFNKNYLISHIFNLLFSSFQNDESYKNVKLAHYKKIVGKAKEMILEDPSMPPSISDICRTLGVSQRTLQICFHEVTDISPNHYLKAIRLNQVRRSLKLADPTTDTVQDIAFNWGFWHASNFTASYKHMFGELPSQTFNQS